MCISSSYPYNTKKSGEIYFGAWKRHLLTKVYLKFVEQNRQNASANLNMAPDCPLSSHQSRIRAQKLFLQVRAGMAKVLSMHLSLLLISLAPLGAPLYGHGPSTVSKPLC